MFNESCILLTIIDEKIYHNNTIFNNTKICLVNNYNDIISRIQNNIIGDDISSFALLFLTQLDPINNYNYGMPKFATDAPPSKREYEALAAQIWQRSACSRDGAPYVARRLILRLSGLKAKNLFKGFAAESEDVPDYDPPLSPFSSESSEPKKLAQAFLDVSCAGTIGLADDEKTTLRAIAGAMTRPASTRTPEPQ